MYFGKFAVFVMNNVTRNQQLLFNLYFATQMKAAVRYRTLFSRNTFVVQRHLQLNLNIYFQQFPICLIIHGNKIKLNTSLYIVSNN